MDRLPSEILREIAGCLDRPDFGSLRLANHRLSAVATVFKFRALRIHVTRKSLDSLVNISRQPELARCVREIVYPCCRLAPLPEPYVRIDPNAEDLPNSSAAEIGPLDRASTMFFQWYNRQYNAQVELEDSGKCVKTLETALGSMTNIRVVVAGHSNLTIRSEFNRWRRELTESEKTTVVSCNWEWQKHWEIMMEPDEVLEAREDADRTIKTVLDLIKIAHGLGMNLDKFEAGVDEYCWLSRGVFAIDSGLWNCISLFENLTSLTVCIVTSVKHDDFLALQKDAKEGRLVKFLSSAPKLRSLSIEMVSRCNDPFEYVADHSGNFTHAIPLFDIVGRSFVWKYLDTFTYIVPPILTAELVDFLGRHARTLKYVHLSSPLLLDGKWRDVLDIMKERLHLTDFSIVFPGEIILNGTICRDYNDAGQRRMEDYILRGGAPFPPTMEEMDENESWDMTVYLMNPEDEMSIDNMDDIDENLSLEAVFGV
ncbi:hypothetical protein RUND412_005814 [Rhizina undulata]